jgi:hypothetical protein
MRLNRAKHALVLVLFLAGCASPCLHQLTFNRYVRRPSQALVGNEMCRACGAVTVSWTYVHPYKGPTRGFHGDDELLIIGGWQAEEK